MASPEKAEKTTLKVEIMLQINQNLLKHGIISKKAYEMTVARIVSRHPGD